LNDVSLNKKFRNKYIKIKPVSGSEEQYTALVMAKVVLTLLYLP